MSAVQGRVYEFKRRRREFAPGRSLGGFLYGLSRRSRSAKKSRITPRVSSHQQFLSFPARQPSVQVSSEDPASCRECQPGERIVVCRSARTTFQCCTHDRNLPSCTPRAGYRGSRAVASTNGPDLLRKCKDNVRRRGNARCKACLRQCCPETNSAGRGLCCRVSS